MYNFPSPNVCEEMVGLAGGTRESRVSAFLMFKIENTNVKGLLFEKAMVLPVLSDSKFFMRMTMLGVHL